MAIRLSLSLAFAQLCLVLPQLYLYIANTKRTMSSSYQRRFVWARDSDNKHAQEHPAHLLLNKNNEEIETHKKFGKRQLNYVWIAWGSTGAVVQIPKGRIREDDLIPRRSRGRGADADDLQIAKDAQDKRSKLRLRKVHLIPRLKLRNVYLIPWSKSNKRLMNQVTIMIQMTIITTTHRSMV